MPLRDPRDEIFYQLMPIAWRRAAGGDVSELARKYRFGNFRGMTDGLAYLSQLGITSVWLNPIFPSRAYHGYQHAFPDRVHPHLGTHDDFRTFVREAHHVGIRVLLDVVLYGTSVESPLFRAAFANPSSPAGDSFAFEDDARTRPFGYTYTTWTNEPVGFVHWDLRNRTVRARLIEASRSWLRSHRSDDAIDGFRLDHVWGQYSSGPAGWGYGLDFWLEWKEAMKRERPDVFTIAEQADWSSYGEDLLPAHDAVMSIPFLFAARRSLQSENAAEFIRTLEQTLLRVQSPERALGVLGNHDVDRLASSIGDGEHGLKAALAILFLSPFPPCIYYGDELGLRGKRLHVGGDQNDLPVRQPMPWTRSASSETTRFHLPSPIARYELARYQVPERSVQAQWGRPSSTLETVRELIALRQRTSALRRGSYRTLNPSTPALWAFMREDGANSIVGCVNLGSRAVRERIPIPGRADFQADLAAYSWLIQPAPNPQSFDKKQDSGRPANVDYPFLRSG